MKMPSYRYAVLPMDVVRVRMKLVDMYESYTTNTDLVQDHLARALKAVSANSAVASRKVNSIRCAWAHRQGNRESFPSGAVHVVHHSLMWRDGDGCGGRDVKLEQTG